jgi:uncharacterized phiE125 gp8 family phage protein
MRTHPKPVAVGGRAFEIRDELLAKAKKQCQVSSTVTVHDTEIADLISEAALQVEWDTVWVLAQSTFDLEFDCWPEGDDPLILPKKPVGSVDSIKYYDEDGTLTEWGSSNWRFDNRRVWPSIWRADFDDSWPDLADDREGLIVVRFTAGHEAESDLDPSARLAVLARVARMWHDRGFNDRGSDAYGPAYRSAVNRGRSSAYL